MRLSIITPNRNGERFLEATIRSIVSQQGPDLELDFIFLDGASTDGSMAIARRYASRITHLVSEPDHGPASAINKGLRLATGDVVGWLNADDFYYPGALQRVAAVMTAHPQRAICFGNCPIVDEQGAEIRKGITRFKQAFFPFSSRFTIQCINYISQPAMFFRRSAALAAGPLREDWRAAWDYEFLLRLWRQGGAVRIPGPPLAAFRWHAASISGMHFRTQFAEELQAACADAGTWSPQALLHRGVRWGIVGSYALMARARRGRAP